MSRLLTAQTVVHWFETMEKCWRVEHRHEPFVCESCGGEFCRWAETAVDDEGIDYCCECWAEPPCDEETADLLSAYVDQLNAGTAEPPETAVESMRPAAREKLLPLFVSARTLSAAGRDAFRNLRESLTCAGPPRRECGCPVDAHDPDCGGAS